MRLLTTLSISYINHISFVRGGGININFLMLGKNVDVCFKRVLSFHFENNDVEEIDDDGFEVVSTLHDYRQLTLDEVKNCYFNVDISECKNMHIITLEGDIYLKIICEIVEIDKSPIMALL
ncbi:MAG: hypothetical protein COA45_01935 [Zetaproteobacteria bacterium]|nr:MAG: hypothetical protein COA45_01935 [Zetaproteobacteria bacterium]